MKKQAFVFILSITILLLAFPSKTFAWGQNGHRIIGEIAEEILSCKAKHKIHKVLSKSSIAMVANWGDFIKSDSKFDEYKNWHYTDFDSFLERYQLDSAAFTTENGECIYRIFYLIDYLKKNPNDIMMLKMLIHIVGDAYQPLHFGRNEDHGGNKIPIQWFGTNTNIHTLWDTKLIEYQNLSYSEYAKHLIQTNCPKKNKFSKKMVLDDIWQTYQNTQKIYNDTTEYKYSSYLYVYNYESMLENQLLRGGIMLASILDYIY